MDQKMDETKRGITLFHEVLKKLYIPHAITGFWEGATSTLRKDQPNYFHEIHTFEDSLYDKNGPKIMQLQPEEDNRDGFSIRLASEKYSNAGKNINSYSSLPMVSPLPTIITKTALWTQMK